MEKLEKQIVRIIENNSPELAAEEILRLLGVVGRSGQLPCGDCENYAEWDNGIRWCSVCGTKLS